MISKIIYNLKKKNKKVVYLICVDFLLNLEKNFFV